MPQYIIFESRVKQLRERLESFGVTQKKLKDFDEWVKGCRRSAMSLTELIIFVMIWPRAVLAQPELYRAD